MKFENVNAGQVQRWLIEQDAILIDVREPAEYANKHIQGASLLPLGKISVNDLPTTDKKIVIYCQKGGRGNSACVKLTDQDDATVVYNLEGGIEAWQQAGNSVVQGESNTLPLDRQVQLTIGTLSVLGSAAAYWLNPAFILVPAFLGLGLTFAGLTGKCGLALVMAKMPWNQKAA